MEVLKKTKRQYNFSDHPKFILALDDYLTVPAKVLHASMYPLMNYHKFLEHVKKEPDLLLGSDNSRVCLLEFSKVRYLLVESPCMAIVEDVIYKSVEYYEEVEIIEVGSRTLVKAGTMKIFSKCVEGMIRQLRLHILRLRK